MTKYTETSSFQPTNILKQWWIEGGRNHILETSDDASRVQFVCKCAKSGEKHDVTLELFVKPINKRFQACLRNRLDVPPARVADMRRTLTWINARLDTDALSCLETPKGNIVEYKVVSEVGASCLTPKQIDGMVDGGKGIFGHYGQLINTVALTEISADTAWTNFRDEEEEWGARGGYKGPMGRRISFSDGFISVIDD